MLASLRHEIPADEERYGWELKWDGLRAIAYVGGGKVRLVSRNDKDMAASYPELAVLAERVGTEVILDGEIVALHHGRPDFGPLQSRMHVLQPDETLLRPRRSSSTCSTCSIRATSAARAALYRAPGAARGARPDADPVRTPPWHRGGAAGGAGRSIAKGLEGVVGKPLDSTYHPDQRRDWIKIKNVKQQESSSAAGNPAKAAARTRSAPCWPASTTTTSAIRRTCRTGLTQDMPPT